MDLIASLLESNFKGLTDEVPASRSLTTAGLPSSVWIIIFTNGMNFCLDCILNLPLTISDDLSCVDPGVEWLRSNPFKQFPNSFIQEILSRFDESILYVRRPLLRVMCEHDDIRNEHWYIVGLNDRFWTVFQDELIHHHHLDSWLSLFIKILCRNSLLRDVLLSEGFHERAFSNCTTSPIAIVLVTY